MVMWPVLFELMVLHNPDGREIDINPAEITSLREAKPDNASDKEFAPGVRCMINLSDGKYVAVIETCQDIRAILADDIKRAQEEDSK
jgi:hypothetical protein